MRASLDHRAFPDFLLRNSLSGLEPLLTCSCTLPFMYLINRSFNAEEHPLRSFPETDEYCSWQTPRHNFAHAPKDLPRRSAPPPISPSLFLASDGLLLPYFSFSSFCLAAANSFRRAASIFGKWRSRDQRASTMAAATTTRVNHLLSAGTTYHGARLVAVWRIVS